MGKIAVLGVDPQKGFEREDLGELPVKGAIEIVEPANRLIAWARANKILNLLSRDWHKVFTRAHFAKWGPHCVENTRGAEFIDGLDTEGALIVTKGTDPDANEYSATDGMVRGLPLVAYLRARGVETVIIYGLATDYCVKATVLALLDAEFEVVVLTDAIRAVNINQHDGDRALDEMRQQGAKLAISEEVIEDVLG